MDTPLLALAERVGVGKAAEQLGLHASLLYGWRSKKQQTQTSSEREQSLAVENARLKRLLTEQAEELAMSSPEIGLHLSGQAPDLKTPNAPHRAFCISGPGEAAPGYRYRRLRAPCGAPVRGRREGTPATRSSECR